MVNLRRTFRTLNFLFTETKARFKRVREESKREMFQKKTEESKRGRFRKAWEKKEGRDSKDNYS